MLLAKLLGVRVEMLFFFIRRRSVRRRSVTEASSLVVLEARLAFGNFFFFVSASASSAELVVDVFAVQFAHRAFPRRRETPVLAPEEQTGERVKRRYALHPKRLHLPRQQTQHVGHRLVHVHQATSVLLLNRRLARRLSLRLSLSLSLGGRRVFDGGKNRRRHRGVFASSPPRRVVVALFRDHSLRGARTVSVVHRGGQRVSPAVLPEGVREPHWRLVHPRERRKVVAADETPRVGEVLQGIERHRASEGWPAPGGPVVARGRYAGAYAPHHHRCAQRVRVRGRAPSGG
mmetsp:Transcript_2530/g.9956  ORF Transcript_2530/g.9956 Transcript_2530/m.9956 type:complete len:289 (-) Transcript_2530:401-1267(-)